MQGFVYSRKPCFTRGLPSTPHALPLNLGKWNRGTRQLQRLIRRRTSSRNGNRSAKVTHFRQRLSDERQRHINEDRINVASFGFIGTLKFKAPRHGIGCVNFIAGNPNIASRPSADTT
jgi:hypothetical protein